MLTGTVLRKLDATKQPSDWRWSAPTLLVVDYRSRWQRRWASCCGH
jgi:hypothetical protein